MSCKKGAGSALSAELRREIISLASQVAIEKFEKERENWKREAVDRRRHNTELLMKNYRSFVVHSEKAVYDASQIEDDLDFDDLLEMMGSKGGHKELSVLSVQESAVRTRTLVCHIDRMLDYFEYRCKHSGRLEDERHWRIIHWRYLVDEAEQKSFQELADEEGLGLSAIYKSHKEAIRQLSALIFGYVVE